MCVHYCLGRNADKAEKISVMLPPDILSIIKAKVEDSVYASTSELIHEAILLWQ